MRKLKLITVALACMLVLTACSGGSLTTTTEDTGVATTIEDSTDSTGSESDIATTIVEVQADMADLASEIQNSAMSAELDESWSNLQTEVLAAVATLTDGGTIDGTTVQTAIDGFQSDLDALGQDVEPTLNEAWTTLKDRLEGLMS